MEELMDLEEIGMSAFSVELLQKLAKDFYDIGREEGFDVGFTTALYSIVFASKKKSAEKAIKAAEDFINGPCANEEAKTRFDELAEIGLDSLGGFDCDESR